MSIIFYKNKRNSETWTAWKFHFVHSKNWNKEFISLFHIVHSIYLVDNAKDKKIHPIIHITKFEIIPKIANITHIAIISTGKNQR